MKLPLAIYIVTESYHKEYKMPVSVDNINFCKYIFGDYVLHSDGILVRENQEVHVPPKELAVLLLLLRASGKIVTKNDIFDCVWSRNPASDESLTRCIYSLRKLLKEDRNTRYIETIYGKGYRFKMQVVVVSLNEQINKATTIALFPFKCFQIMDETMLHRGLIQGLSKYSYIGLNVLPASATQDCHEFQSLNALIQQLKPDYYITGKIVESGDKLRLFIELIRSYDHKLLEHQSVVLEKGNHIPFILSKIIVLLTAKVPELKLSKNEKNQSESFDVAISCLNGRRELQHFTPESLQNALILFQLGIKNNPLSSQLYCLLSECYLSLAQLGLYEQQLAIELATNAVEKAVEIDPNSPHALGILALLTGLKGEMLVAKVLFKQAQLIMPDSSDVSYFYAIYLILEGNISEAVKFLDLCLQNDSSKISAVVLKLLLTFYHSSAKDALSLGLKYVKTIGHYNPVICSIISLLSALCGDKELSAQYLSEYNADNDSGYVKINTLYTRFLLYGSNVMGDISKFLAISDNKIIDSSLAPLLELCKTKKKSNPDLNSNLREYISNTLFLNSSGHPMNKEIKKWSLHEHTT